jgi:(2Fe-2S) ferredoxin
MDKPRFRAYICCGPNCGPKGAAALVDFLEAELARRGLDGQVSVAATGCQAHCESGPTMVVYPGPIYYQGMDRDRLARIAEEHLALGVPVKEYFWSGVRRRILPDGTVITPKRVIMPEGDDSYPVGEQVQRKPKPRKPPPEVDDFKW